MAKRQPLEGCATGVANRPLHISSVQGIRPVQHHNRLSRPGCGIKKRAQGGCQRRKPSTGVFHINHQHIQIAERVGGYATGSLSISVKAVDRSAQLHCLCSARLP